MTPSIVPKGTVYLTEEDKTSLETRNGVVQARFVFYTITQWNEGEQISPDLPLEFRVLRLTRSTDVPDISGMMRSQSGTQPMKWFTSRQSIH